MRVVNITQNILKDDEGLNSFILPISNNGKIEKNKTLFEINKDKDKAIVGLIEKINSKEDKLFVHFVIYNKIEYINAPVWKIDSIDSTTFTDMKQAEFFLQKEFNVISKDLFEGQEMFSPGN